MNENSNPSTSAGERTTLLRKGQTQSGNRMLALVILRKGIEGGGIR